MSGNKASQYFAKFKYLEAINNGKNSEALNFYLDD